MKIAYKLSIFTLLFISLSFSAATISAQKMSAEEIVAKHLDSIGTKEKRAEVKNRLLISDVKLTVKGTSTPVAGRAVFLSAGEKNLLGMNLNSNDYPQDRFGFDGKDTRVGYSRPGVRSTLGGFIYSYKELLKEGLLGGTLMSSWALANADNAKMSFEGTKKIEGKETLVVSYQPKNGSDLSIKMFFDAKNYRHVRTEYNRVISARQGTGIDNSANQSSDRYRLVEDFSDFQNVAGLTLPKTYKLSYSYTGTGSTQVVQNNNRELEWTFSVTNFAYNQELDGNSFNIDAK